MITTLPQDELLELGARHRADYLAEQAGYTLELAAKDGAPLAALLPKNYLTEMKEALAKLTEALQDKALMAEESKNATGAQNEAYARGKVWRRRVMYRCRRAARMGTKMPDELTKPGDVRSVPALSGQLDRMIKLLESVITSSSTENAALIKEGLAISQTLKTADAAQELKCLKELPDAVKAFYLQKGTLYVGLKVINDAGRELHAESPEQASAYNLSILRRRHGVKKEQQDVPEAQETK